MGRFFYRPRLAAVEQYLADFEGIPMQSARCGACCRRTGEPCRNWGIRPSRRCRMHGGKGSGRPATSGKFTAARAKTLRGLRCLLAVLEAVEEKRKPV